MNGFPSMVHHSLGDRYGENGLFFVCCFFIRIQDGARHVFVLPGDEEMKEDNEDLANVDVISDLQQVVDWVEKRNQA